MSIVRKAVMGMMAVNRLREGGHANTIGGQTSKEKEALREEVEKRKQEAEHVRPHIVIGMSRDYS
jgi:hypothetical protein